MSNPSGIETVDVAVIGGGISGLSAAYELGKRKRSVVVLERAERPGGVIQTERVGDLVIDAGPDALLVQKPAAVALCNELGLGDRLFPTKLPRTAFILRDGKLHALPGASVLGFPTRVRPMLHSTLFGLGAKLRMGAELFIPRRTSSDDESIAAFVGRRFGLEAVTYIAEPLLAGIHAGDVERLSMRALFPRLIDAETSAGSVIRLSGGRVGP
jgi:oxygen-dependent protoporphyrinogen oxidase